MRIGAHVSVAGGLTTAVEQALAAGCETYQVFASNPRTWALPPVDRARDEHYLARLGAPGIGPVFAHAPYLVNLASPDQLTWERSRALVAWTLERAAALGIGGVVVHAGSDLGAGRDDALKRTREAVLPLLDALEGPELLFELTAGTRNSVASRFEQMAELLAVLGDHPRVKVCFDTCHAHAAGYDLSTTAGATAAVDLLLAAVGARVALVHANDSVEPAGACRDRHADIGHGTIGDAGFAAVLAHPGLASACMVTETAGEVADHARNVRRLKRLRDQPV